MPLGTFLFMLLCHSVTGSFFALFEIQSAWLAGERLNPVSVLWNSLFGKDLVDMGNWAARPFSLGSLWTFIPSLAFGSAVSIYVLSVLARGIGKTGMPLFVYSLFLTLFPLSTSQFVTAGMPRYCLAVFPVFIILAQMKSGNVSHYAAIAVMAAVQAFTMALWTNSFHFPL